MSSFWVVELRDSDGNDCAVYSIIVKGSDCEGAMTEVWDYIDANWSDDEPDGDSGTYHPCYCRCAHDTAWDGICEICIPTWECDHGGLSVDIENIEGPFAMHTDAKAVCPQYNCIIDLGGEKR